MDIKLVFFFLLLSFSSFAQNEGNICYFGNNGGLFYTQESSEAITTGEVFSTGDVIGCHLNMHDRSCKFSKNGLFIRKFVENVKVDSDLFPTVGFDHSSGAAVRVNFSPSCFFLNRPDSWDADLNI